MAKELKTFKARKRSLFPKDMGNLKLRLKKLKYKTYLSPLLK